MLLAQEFKTLAGAQKRAAFENAHCGKRYVYLVVRCVDGKRDVMEFYRERAEAKHYTWRLERQKRS